MKQVLLSSFFNKYIWSFSRVVVGGHVWHTVSTEEMAAIIFIIIIVLFPVFF